MNYQLRHLEVTNSVISNLFDSLKFKTEQLHTITVMRYRNYPLKVTWLRYTTAYNIVKFNQLVFCWSLKCVLLAYKVE